MAGYFTQELGDSSDGRKRFHFRKAWDRERLTKLLDGHIKASEAPGRAHQSDPGVFGGAGGLMTFIKVIF